MRSSASTASLLTLLALGAAVTGCGGTDTSSSTGGTGGTTASTTGGTGGMTTTGGTGGATGGTGGTGGATGGTGGTTGGTGGATGGTGGGPPTFEVVDCQVPDFDPPADPNATCEVTMPGNAAVMLRGTILSSDKVIHKGEVLVGADGKIACVDCDCSGAAGADQATVVTCAQGVISPGLINTHDHITFAKDKPVGANTPNADGGHQTNNERYEHRHQWRKGQDGHTQLTAPGSSTDDQIRLAELRFMMSGATTAASAGGATGLMRNVDVAGMGEGITFAVNSDTFPLKDSAGLTDIDLSDGCTYGSGVATSATAATGDAYLPHISEGINVAAHTEFVCTSSAPPPAGANDIIGPKTSIIHGVGITAEDVGTIRLDQARLIWSPRSNVDLYGNTAAVTMFDALGVPIALGTDWVASGSMNLIREMHCVDELNATYFNGHFSDYQMWRMVTVNGALALGQEKKLGDLKQGLWGDVAIFNGKTKTDHRAVVGAELTDVVLVLRGGEVMYGDDALVEDLRPGCSPLAWNGGGNAQLAFTDVCGAVKRTCLNLEDTIPAPHNDVNVVVGTTATTYPLFFCPTAANPSGTPTREPSCVPYRAEYSAGIAAADKDGDGIANGADNCPDIFNPVKPLDDDIMPNKQADFDGDGVGDVCDACPLDAQNSCGFNDIDGDGKPNDTDNCPKDANPGQADADSDGHGDLCDSCPNDANPGAMPCPAPVFTVKSLRDPTDPNHPAVGTPVLLKDLYVTAVDNIGNGRGFFMQDTSLMPYTGIFVFTAANAPTVQVGNKVNVQGVYKEFNTQSELDTPFVTITDAGTMLPFAPIDVADPATIATGGNMAEKYESMLLKIGAVSISNINPDGPNSDFDEFAVSPGNLRIDDQVFDLLNNNCAVGTQFTSITGVLAFTFSNSKILPRSAADIVQPAGQCNPTM